MIKPGALRLDALADERRNHVRGLQVEVVPRAIQVHRQHIGALQSVLSVVTIQHHHGGLLGDAVGRIGLLWVAVPEVLLPERHRRELGVGADGSGLHELLDAVHARPFDQVQGHGHVRVEVATRVRHVGADATHLGRQVHHHLRSHALVHALHLHGVGQVELGAARHQHFGGTQPTQPFAHGPAKKAGASGDHDSLAAQWRGHGSRQRYPPVIRRGSRADRLRLEPLRRTFQ